MELLQPELQVSSPFAFVSLSFFYSDVEKHRLIWFFAQFLLKPVFLPK